MIPNLQIPNWDVPEGGGALSPFSSSNDSPSFSSDNFRMFQYKVRNCPRGRSHDWTECPYAHPGEKARRRDPRKFHYSGTACPDYRKGTCERGDTCQFAHGVFECWLHPSRYRTQICKDGTSCRRRVCFFAHANHQLRHVSNADSKTHHFVSSPTSVINSSFSDSPPSSPYGVVHSMREIINSMRNVKLEEEGPYCCVFGSPRGGFLSPNGCEEEPAMERVESGRDIRARIYAKLSMENAIGASAPDIGWISELVQ